MNPQEYTFQTLFGSTLQSNGEDIILRKIEIPIIQRDYAQGRTNEKVEKIRTRFLNALYNAITRSEHITLDFVYGDISSEGILTPLDGQQRLTTLFLLHWYIAKKEKGSDVANYEFLNKFTYATRFSSRDFCKELVRYTPDFNEKKLSDTIIDQYWYPSQWKNDPTIQGMLVMLDAIHSKFKNDSNLWESLVENKIISFYFLPLTEMGLTDELYIKMNSRGKPLTSFEHFKAEFEEIIKQESEELSNEVNHKFDIEWTDMLFPFRGSNDIIDDEFMRYFHFISDIICYQSDLKIQKDEFDVAKLIYSSDNCNAKNNICFLKDAFDCWCDIDINNFFQSVFSDNTYQSGKVKIYQSELNIFKECLNNYGEYTGRNRKFPLNKILLLYAILIYLLNKDKISKEDLVCRIRVVRNLIWNSEYEIREDRMKTLLNETKEVILSGAIPRIVDGVLGYNIIQKEEEINKLNWLIENPNEVERLYHLEDHNLLKGCIAIIGLENSGNFDKFRTLFNTCNKDLINSALLATGDYSQTIGWRVQIGSKSNDSAWLNLFHPTKQRGGFEETKRILNELLSSLCEVNEQELKLNIDTYISSPNTIIDWRYYLVKYSPMRKGNFGMYYWEDLSNKNYNAIMMNTEKSLGGRNWNIFLYALSKFPQFETILSLGEYGYQGDVLLIKNTGYRLNSLNDKFVIIDENNIETEYLIQQNNGADIEDRIIKAEQIIEDLQLKFTLKSTDASQL